MTPPFLKLRMAVVAGVVAGSTMMLFTSTVGASMVKLASDTGDVTTTVMAPEEETTTTSVMQTTTTVAETTTTTIAEELTTTSTAAPAMTTETRTVEAGKGGTVTITRVGKTLTLDSYVAADGFTAYVKQVKGNQIKVEFSDGERRIKVHAHTANDTLKVKTVEAAAGNSGKSHKSTEGTADSEDDESGESGKRKK